MIKKEKMEVAVDIVYMRLESYFISRFKKTHAPTYILFGGKFIFFNTRAINI